MRAGTFIQTEPEPMNAILKPTDSKTAALEKDSSDPALKNYSILAEKNDGDADRLIAKEN